MKTFQIKSSLAAGLTHRLKTLDAQMVVDACVTDAIESIRANLRIVRKIEEANKTFMDAIGATESKKRAVLETLRAEYTKESEGKAEEEKKELQRDLTAKFNVQAVEIQKESTANPDEIVTVELADDDYNKVLMPVFKKTVQLWDVNGDGHGQELFLQVADALQPETETESTTVTGSTSL